MSRPQFGLTKYDVTVYNVRVNVGAKGCNSFTDHTQVTTSESQLPAAKWSLLHLVVHSIYGLMFLNQGMMITIGVVTYEATTIFWLVVFASLFFHYHLQKHNGQYVRYLMVSGDISEWTSAGLRLVAWFVWCLVVGVDDVTYAARLP